MTSSIFTEDRSDNIFCKVIVALVSIGIYYIYFQVDVISSQFAVAFKIPLNNISIYFDKLYSFKFLSSLVGLGFEFFIFKLFLIITDTEKVKIRGYINLTFYSFLLFSRVIFLLILYFSQQLGYHVYIILSIESFFYSCCITSFISIVPEHILIVLLYSNLTRIISLFIQFILDLTIKNPMIKIKIQVWICVIFTLITIILWIYYLVENSCLNLDKIKNLEKDQKNENQTKSFLETLRLGYSPFIMYFISTFFKDLLFPGMLPYALLHRDKCHLINLLLPIVCLIPPLFFYFLEKGKVFTKWNDYFNIFWICIIPMIIIFVYSLLSVHTQIKHTKIIRNSRPRVMTLTYTIILCHGFLMMLSMSGVPKIVTTGFEDGEGDIGLISVHRIVSEIFRFFCSKVSVGYHVVRVSLGYYLPKFRPIHKMSASNTFWYIFKNTFRTSLTDFIKDFRINVKDYL